MIKNNDTFISKLFTNAELAFGSQASIQNDKLPVNILLINGIDTFSIKWVNDVSNRFTDRVSIDFDEHYKAIGRKKFYTLLLSIKMNSYTYPPNDIRKIMYNFLLKVEKEYDDDCCKKQFENAKSICNNLNRKTNFYEFLMCLKRTKYILPQNIREKLFDMYMMNDRYNKYNRHNAAPSA